MSDISHFQCLNPLLDHDSFFRVPSSIHVSHLTAGSCPAGCFRAASAFPPPRKSLPHAKSRPISTSAASMWSIYFFFLGCERVHEWLMPRFCVLPCLDPRNMFPVWVAPAPYPAPGAPNRSMSEHVPLRTSDPPPQNVDIVSTSIYTGLHGTAAVLSVPLLAPESPHRFFFTDGDRDAAYPGLSSRQP